LIHFNARDIFIRRSVFVSDVIMLRSIRLSSPSQKHFSCSSTARNSKGYSFTFSLSLTQNNTFCHAQNRRFSRTGSMEHELKLSSRWQI